VKLVIGKESAPVALVNEAAKRFHRGFSTASQAAAILCVESVVCGMENDDGKRRAPSGLGLLAGSEPSSRFLWRCRIAYGAT